MRPHRAVFLIFAGLVAALAPSAAAAFDGIGLYLDPVVGGAWINFKSIELADEFIVPPKPGEEAELPDLSDLRRQVGQKANYQGGGLHVGGSGGLLISRMRLGLRLSYARINSDGYWKRYRYNVELARAGGRKILDNGYLELRRVEFELGYGQPVWRFEIGVATRIGRITLDPNGLVMGRATERSKGLSTDFGLRIDFNIVRNLAIGVIGEFGFFMFDGMYEGAYGAVGSFGGQISARL